MVRYVFIALFILVFNISIALVNSLDVLQSQDLTNSEWFSDITQQQGNEIRYSSSVGAEEDVVRSTGDIGKALGILNKILRSIVDVPFVFQLLGVPFSLAIILSMPVYFFYVLAIAQVILKFQVESW